jgi:hypothetical protein
MSKFKYAVKNGDHILGLMWDAGNNREIFVTNGAIDINHDLEIRDCDGNDIDNIDLKTLLLEILPR